MGIVVDRNIAFQYCHGYKLNGELILWSVGVIGALSNTQEKLCKEIKFDSKVPKKLEKRYKGFKESANICEGKHLSEFLRCMSVELEKRGIKV